MTPKQRLFVEEYLVDLNATQVAIRAGYSPRSARQHADQLLTKHDIAAAIQAAMAERSMRTKITADRVLVEYARIGFANMADFLRFQDGDAYLDFSDLTEDQTRAIAEITQEVELSDDDSRPAVKRTRFKMHNKLGALDALAKHLGLTPDRKDVTVRGRVDHARTHTRLPPAIAERIRAIGGPRAARLLPPSEDEKCGDG